MEMQAPLLKKSFLANHAIAFRQEYGAEYAPRPVGPIDIEAILEFELRVEIVPREDLFRERGVHGYLSVTGRSIVVDESLQKGDLLEYYALLVHETAHKKLHGPLLPKRLPRNAHELARFHSMSERQRLELEFQARTWSSRVMMPTFEVHLAFAAAVEASRDRFAHTRSGASRVFVEEQVAAAFAVSPARAAIRISELSLWKTVQRESVVRVQPAFPGEDLLNRLQRRPMTG